MPPAGAKKGQDWIVAPAADGGACLSVGGAVWCGHAKDIAEGGLVGLRVSSPETNVRKTSGPGFGAGAVAHLTGFGPAGTVKAVAVGPTGSPIGQTAVGSTQTYALDVPADALGVIEFLDASGAKIGSSK